MKKAKFVSIAVFAAVSLLGAMAIASGSPTRSNHDASVQRQNHDAGVQRTNHDAAVLFEDMNHDH